MPRDPFNAANIVDRIREGRFDADLSRINKAIQARNAARAAADPPPDGTRVQFGKNISPQYLTGVTGKVIGQQSGGKRAKKGFIWVKIDRTAQARKYSASICQVPLTSLEPAPKE